MNTLLSRSISLLTVVTVYGLAAARPAHSEDLAAVVAYAYETNPGLQSQRAALRALDENYVQARSGYGLNASVTAGETSYDEALAGQRQYANTHSEALSVTQPLYTGGRVHSQLNEAEAQILAGRETLRRYEISLLTQVVASYVYVRRDEALLKVNQDTVTVLEKEMADTQAKFDVREVTMTDVAEAKARLAQARATLASAEAALGVSRAQFVSVVGQLPGSLEAPPVLSDLPAAITPAFDSAEENNPQLLAAEYTEQRSRARIAEARAGRLPTVSLQLGVQHTPYLPYAPQPYNYAATASVVVTQSLFTGGQVSSQIRQALEQNNSDRLTIDDTRNQVILGVTSAWEQLSSVRKALKALEDAGKADTFSFYGNREEEKLALRTTIDVLNAELELTNTQQSIIRARADEYVDQVQMLAVMGVLNVAMLSSDVKLYDPAKNFRAVEHKGETPLEWPVHALDAIGGVTVGKNPAASVAEVRPNASAMPAAPGPETPLPSILTTLTSPPPEPK